MGTLLLKMLEKGLVLICAVVLAQARTGLDSQWEDFKSKYVKVYSVGEEKARRAIWEDNYHFIERHNAAYEAGLETYSVGENEYNDLTHIEFTSMLTGLQPVDPRGLNPVFQPLNYSDVRSEVDWRTDGYVTPVKNQGQCGSCWAFATTGSLEGAHFKQTGDLVSLSEQQLVDCSTRNLGCNGGIVDWAFQYIQKHGITSEEQYPYKGRQGHCHFHADTTAATLSTWKDIRRGSESDLQAAVSQQGPVAVAIDAGHRGFQMYKHGIYYDSYCSHERLNHAVLAVGYGTESDGQYWIVKNSWGTGWGDQGYIKMAKGRNNNCGIATQASFAVV